MTSEEALTVLTKITTLVGPHIAPDWPVGLRIMPKYSGGHDGVFEVLGYTTRGWLILGRTDNEHNWCVDMETAAKSYKPCS